MKYNYLKFKLFNNNKNTLYRTLFYLLLNIKYLYDINIFTYYHNIKIIIIIK